MFIVVGTNYKYSPIEIRERLSISKGKLRDALAELTHNEYIKGAVILSTCNRIEVYASVEDINEGIAVGTRFIASDLGSDKSDPYLYTYTDKEAASHLFEVACGLDSQIIGERQILGQVEFAWQEAKRIEATDRVTDIIFDKAIKTSLKIRRETRLSAGDVSVASIVLDLVKTQYGGIKDKKLLIIGVGKISELIVKHLKEEQAKAVFIANKTYEKAKLLANSINAEVVRFDALKDKLKEADIVISATGSPHLILKKGDVLESLNSQLRTHNSQLLIIDLAVPRDVDPDVKDIEGITLFNLDNLDFIIDKSLNQRKQEIPKARDIIKEEVQSLCSTGNLELEPEEALLP